jgi:hypothetical protein
VVRVSVSTFATTAQLSPRSDKCLVIAGFNCVRYVPFFGSKKTIHEGAFETDEGDV